MPADLQLPETRVDNNVVRKSATTGLYREKYRVESTRLTGWDYAAPGWYFVTVCTRGRACFFGRVAERRMHLSRIGEIAHQYWEDIPNHSANAGLDAFVIMPNHVHGIVRINAPDANDVRNDVGGDVRDNVGRDVACNVSTTARIPTTEHDPIPGHDFTTGDGSGGVTVPPGRGSLGAIVRSYKAAVTRSCHANGYADFAWQPRFYDRIVRDERALRNVRRYILENPARWVPGETGIYR